MNTEKYTLTQDEAGYWHVVDIETNESWETCEQDAEQAKRALIEHAIYHADKTAEQTLELKPVERK
jgi:hypothetical protein